MAMDLLEEPTTAGGGVENHLSNYNFLHEKNEPNHLVSFSPDRNRFESMSSSVGTMDLTDLLMSNKDQSTTFCLPTNHNEYFHQSDQPQKDCGISMKDEVFEIMNQKSSQLQKKLERHIAQAHVNVQSPVTTKINHESSWSKEVGVINGTESTRNGKSSTRQQSSMSPCQNSMSSGPDIRNKGLLPPQRLAIPRKPNSVGLSAHLHTQEVKPLVQWDTDDSEEELSFFPTPKARLTDSFSIDALSLSGEEEDLHLTPPKPTTPRCPCDPRCLLQSKFSARNQKQCQIT